MVICPSLIVSETINAEEIGDFHEPYGALWGVCMTLLLVPDCGSLALEMKIVHFKVENLVLWAGILYFPLSIL
jgi:hypothetical protein